MIIKSGGRRTRIKGFTLIEILVAIAVLAIAFVSFYRLFSQAIAADGVSRFYTIAPLLAQQKTAEISSGAVSADHDGSGSFEDYPGYNWQLHSFDVVSESLGTAVSDMKQVDITISVSNDTRRYDLRTYVFLRD